MAKGGSNPKCYIVMVQCLVGYKVTKVYPLGTLIFMRVVACDTLSVFSLVQQFYVLNDLPDAHFIEKKWQKNKIKQNPRAPRLSP